MTAEEPFDPASTDQFRKFVEDVSTFAADVASDDSAWRLRELARNLVRDSYRSGRRRFAPRPGRSPWDEKPGLIG
jgi:hypothetical protein